MRKKKTEIKEITKNTFSIENKKILETKEIENYINININSKKWNKCTSLTFVNIATSLTPVNIAIMIKMKIGCLKQILIKYLDQLVKDQLLKIPTNIILTIVNLSVIKVIS